MHVHSVSASVPIPESALSRVSRRVSVVENDITQLDTILGGEEVVPNVETEDIEENEGDVEPSED